MDRKKDAIRRRGENISSWEVEQAAVAHPAVTEAAAYPVPTELTEDDVAIALVLVPGATLDEQDFARHCADLLPGYALPRYLTVLPELAETPTGKVEKFRLRHRVLRRRRRVQPTHFW
ncbi:AMP-binding enzyme [Pseudonocardia sp. RS010]|uniref:AMP-binding enzyme n=1 Tax=Pseudonocardia sp. RS010 TaxID=3385979 RepID=UPI0039A30817